MKQLSVFIENQCGKLLEVTNTLKSENIDILAISIAETQEFGIARMIVDDITKAEKSLKDKGFACNQTNVLVIEISSKPGGLASLLEIFNNNNINVEYMYGFLGRTSAEATMVFRVKNYDNAKQILSQQNIKFNENLLG